MKQQLKNWWQRLLLSFPFIRRLLEYSDASDDRQAERKREERRRRDKERRLSNSIVLLLQAHPECDWKLRPATEEEKATAGLNQQIDFSIELEGATLYMSKEEAKEVLDYVSGSVTSS